MSDDERHTYFQMARAEKERRQMLDDSNGVRSYKELRVRGEKRWRVPVAKMESSTPTYSPLSSPMSEASDCLPSPVYEQAMPYIVSPYYFDVL